MRYTVLLVYPDYISDSGETYLAHVTADNPADAVGEAQAEAAKFSADPPDDPNDPEDFRALVVFSGHLEDLHGATG